VDIIAKRTSSLLMPYTRADARVQLKNEEDSFDDSLIDALVKASAELAENKTNRSFMQATYEWKGQFFPACDIEGYVTLRPGPLVGVTSVKYYADGSASQTTMTPGTDYEVDTNSTPGRIRFLNSLPDVDDRTDAVEIIFVSGYGAAAANEATQQTALANAVPGVVAWMKIQLATLYKHREAIVAGQSVAHLNTFVDNLIYPYIL
jgi:uncharacterized phiE125 gp8 family phage protein